MAYRPSNPYRDMPVSAAIAVLAVCLIGGIGWVVNVVKIIGAFGEPISAMFLARCVGTFVAPLGAILGWF